MTMRREDRYVVVSADGHAGANLDTYKDYLPSRFHDDFEAWRTTFVTEWADLRDTDSREYRRNHDSTIRQEDLEGDGIAGEVLYPNTVPPFEVKRGLHGHREEIRDAPELERRWAGIHAHNRWLVDFCAELPGRRAGVAQLLFEDVDRAVQEVRWVAEQGLFGGVLIPNPSPTSTLPQLHAARYEPIWAECEAVGLPVHTHGGGGVPDYGDHPTSTLMMFLEFGWYGYRPLVRLMMSGVFKRHPALKFVQTEVGWSPEILEQLDLMARQVRQASKGSVGRRFGGDEQAAEQLLPSEYWRRQCYLGMSLMVPHVAANRDQFGTNTVLWGADYPHSEGTNPYTWQHYRHVFAGLPTDAVARLIGLNAVEAFGFDLGVLRPVADRIGPTVADVDSALPLDEFPPPDAHTMSFARPAAAK